MFCKTSSSLCTVGIFVSLCTIRCGSVLSVVVFCGNAWEQRSQTLFVLWEWRSHAFDSLSFRFDASNKLKPLCAFNVCCRNTAVAWRELLFSLFMILMTFLSRLLLLFTSSVLLHCGKITNLSGYIPHEPSFKGGASSNTAEASLTRREHGGGRGGLEDDRGQERAFPYLLL